MNQGAGTFGTIVVALDGSETAERGIPLAVALAKRDGARLIFVHVEQLVSAAGTVVPVNPQVSELRSRLEDMVKGLADEGVEARLETRDMVLGGPARSIAEIADVADADLIVAGSRGHTGLGGLFLGSVTQRLVKICHRPVLVVPPERG